MDWTIWNLFSTVPVHTSHCCSSFRSLKFNWIVTSSCLCSGMFSISQMKNRPMILIGGWHSCTYKSLTLSLFRHCSVMMFFLLSYAFLTHSLFIVNYLASGCIYVWTINDYWLLFELWILVLVSMWMAVCEISFLTNVLFFQQAPHHKGHRLCQSHKTARKFSLLFVSLQMTHSSLQHQLPSMAIQAAGEKIICAFRTALNRQPIFAALSP